MKNHATSNPSIIPRMFVGLIRIYQRLVSPLFPPSCRFSPTCSEYAVQAFLIHGLFKGFWMSSYRILRCNPLNHGGFDPVPPKK